jgi:hypothetical protein
LEDAIKLIEEKDSEISRLKNECEDARENKAALNEVIGKQFT